ncbi:MAG: FkbM family methyltransferase [Crocinitomicaceae bacterium]|jgi:FkbM family methyltransferase
MYNDLNYLSAPLEINNELASYFDSNKVKLILDIGACDGLDSIKYARLFSHSIVYSFEPLSYNFELIKKNLINYNVKNVIPLQLALSNEKGLASFYVSSGRPEEIPEEINWDFGNKSSSLLEPNKTKEIHPWLKFQNKIEIKTDILENFLNEKKIKLVDFVHMDVQGAELMVLQGAGKFIRKIKMIWLEVENVELYKNQPLASDVEHFLKCNGFSKIKDTVNHIAGDQLWVNYNYFPIKRLTSIIYRLFRKLGLIK